ncbi:hypothetical protein [Heliophilum fasciatum]|uniref:Uncharacterized protein n=1 Tax=Heliophilum fasciatum TaxID=35700 RepID=A0A4R2RKY4_9FIRM|nr:hypothetical protein [Heliophilum fasciatum]MCW2277870.1 hypothetical protein [Heliophilum fasciatum]TCP64560.1 hypothetical protein EDD73_109102 [Heliophilum fasciatum]
MTERVVKRRNRGMTKANMKRELTDNIGNLEHLQELFTKYPRIFIEASSQLPDKLKIKLEKIIQERVPEVYLQIGERARRQALEEEKMANENALSFEEIVRLTVEKENQKVMLRKKKI